MNDTTNATANWEALDAELGRWLRARATKCASRDRKASPLDGVAMALRRMRSTLGATAAAHEPKSFAVVSLAYRWAIRVGRELESIEQLELDGVGDWARFEAFAPFALAFYDSALAPAVAAANADDESRLALERVRRELDAGLGFLTTASASAWAA